MTNNLSSSIILTAVLLLCGRGRSEIIASGQGHQNVNVAKLDESEGYELNQINHRIGLRVGHSTSHDRNGHSSALPPDATTNVSNTKGMPVSSFLRGRKLNSGCIFSGRTGLYNAVVNFTTGVSVTDCNLPIGEWDVSRVTNMRRLFDFGGCPGATFNSDIGGWNVSSVTNMQGMFANANTFSWDLSDWDVSRVTDMFGMFGYNTVFNGDISGWDVSSVKDMRDMFNFNSKFNGDLSAWDTSSVTKTDTMFSYATAFNQGYLCWDVSQVTSDSDMFLNAGSATPAPFNTVGCAPTNTPTKAPTDQPTKAPTDMPTKAPSDTPTKAPTKAPTDQPTKAPTDAPTKAPTDDPTKAPTDSPTTSPTQTGYCIHVIGNSGESNCVEDVSEADCTNVFATASTWSTDPTCPSPTFMDCPASGALRIAERVLCIANRLETPCQCRAQPTSAPTSSPNCNYDPRSVTFVYKKPDSGGRLIERRCQWLLDGNNVQFCPDKDRSDGVPDGTRIWETCPGQCPSQSGC